jgi:hypothetical protein
VNLLARSHLLLDQAIAALLQAPIYKLTKIPTICFDRDQWPWAVTADTATSAMGHKRTLRRASLNVRFTP